MSKTKTARGTRLPRQAADRWEERDAAILFQPWIPFCVYEVQKVESAGLFRVIHHVPRQGLRETLFTAFTEYQAHAIAQALRDFHVNGERPPHPLQPYYSVPSVQAEGAGR